MKDIDEIIQRDYVSVTDNIIYYLFYKEKRIMSREEENDMESYAKEETFATNSIYNIIMSKEIDNE